MMLRSGSFYSRARRAWKTGYTFDNESNSHRRFRHITSLIERMERFCEPSNVAIGEDGQSYSYPALLRASCTLARQISKVAEEQTVVEGGKQQRITAVGAFHKPCVPFVVTMLATWMVGKTFVPLSASQSKDELNYVISDSKVGLVVCTDPSIVSQEFISSLSVPLVKSIVFETGTSIYEKPKNDEISNSHVQKMPQDAALIIYTSGTTGRPKGVVHTVSSVEHMIKSLVTAWKYSEHDKILHFLPLYHVHGLVNKLLCMLWVGGEVQFLPSAAPQVVWDRLAEEAPLNLKSHTGSNTDGKKLSLFMAVPTVYAKMLEYANSTAEAAAEGDVDAVRRYIHLHEAMTTVHQLRLMVSGSAALPDPIMDGWHELTGHILLERYGMSEIGMALSNLYEGPVEVTVKGKGDETGGAGKRKGYVGVPLPYVQCRLVDAETEKEVLTTDTPGELRIKGQCVFREYLNKPAVSIESFDAEGWFKTGDIAERADDGFYKILGRNSTDIIKSSGYKLSALEIERELLSHPQVLEAAVIGLPDLTLGERVVAVVALRESRGALNKVIDILTASKYHNTDSGTRRSVFEDPYASLSAGRAVLQAVKSFLQSRLAGYKQPRDVWIVTHIPRNQMGKVNKKTLANDILETRCK